MSAQLRTQKCLLTTFINKLEHIVSKLRDKKLEELPIDPNAPSTVAHEHLNAKVGCASTAAGHIIHPVA
ncbi:hypothetical protein Aduo_016812 [Ancylostoma duodenale]